MNKLPAKQIYLLAVIVIGLIALSVYSTYALFTFESSTSDIISIHTPKSLKISENIYEYQQITIEPNTITTTDIDIYNTFEYSVCYSIWYKIIENDIDTSKVQIFEINNENLTSSGVLNESENIRITIAIINDNDEPVKINLGTIGAKKENDSCSLNLASDKNQINLAIKDIKILQDEILNEKEIVKEEIENYHIYQEENDKITYKETDKIYISNKFTYENEIFTLEEPIETTIGEILEKEKTLEETEKQDIYFCKETEKCSILYKINEIETEERIIEQNENDIENEEEKKEIYYHITKYDKLIGYLGGNNGLRKINENDYVFYGDNPNNYIYYNCETDNKTSCELWRIIGFFYNKETEKHIIKIVRNESLGKYQIDADSNDEQIKWNNSSLYTYLNEEYKIKNKYYNREENNQVIETLTSLTDQFKFEVIESETPEENNPLVNILSLSDYINASICEKDSLSEYTSECIKNNWLNNIEINSEWTSTFKEENIEKEEIIEEETFEENETEENNELINNQEIEQQETEENQEEINIENNTEEIEKIYINYAYSISDTITENTIDTSLDVRPVIYLKSRTLLVEGDGSFNSPYIIK